MVNICVTTILIGNLSYKPTAKKNHQKYCDKHGYKYVCLEEKLNDFHPMWMKPDLLIKCLEDGYDYVFWMDGDSFFLNMDIKLEKFVDMNVDFVATGDQNDIVNAGHLFFKNSEWSKKFLNDWSKFRTPMDHRTCEQFKLITTHITYYKGQVSLLDQSPINILLGGGDQDKMSEWFIVFNKVNFWEGNPFRLYDVSYSPLLKENLERTNSILSDDMKKHVHIVEQRAMNSYRSNYQKGDFILHFAEGNKELVPILVPQLVSE